MADKMTPGPWIARLNFVFTETSREVAYCKYNGQPRGGAEAEANARAIAALPELMGAAKAISDEFDGLVHHDKTWSLPLPIELLRALRVALAKAGVDA